MKRIALALLVLTLSACGSIEHQQVAYVDSEGVPRDSLGRDATDAGKPLCSNVTLGRHGVFECRIR